MPGFPALTLLGALAMLAILLTTYFTSVFKMTLVFGVPFLLALSALYYLLFRKRGERAALRAGWSVHEACAGLAQGGQHGAGAGRQGARCVHGVDLGRHARAEVTV